MILTNKLNAFFYKKNLVNIVSIMRGVAPFNELWERRDEIDLSGVGEIAVIGLPDLVKAKKHNWTKIGQ